MNIDEIIEKKRNNNELTYDELYFAFNNYLLNKIKDDKMAVLLHIILTNGFTYQEIFNLTDIFIKSGKILDFSDLKYTADKHSTGGVGDKTTLIICPLVASCGVYVPKMSGRSLGYTGGTIDKLESIKGFKSDIDIKKFKELVKKNHYAICSQSKKLVPMDAKVYALRDITGTTKSIPLIAVSIMSKKIACGAKNILIDIKYGKGALLNNKDEAKELSEIMKNIAIYYKKNLRTIMSDMNNPLGNMIGNSLEVKEALEVLNNNVKNDLTELSLNIASEMVSMAKGITYRRAHKEVKNNLINGSAYKLFEQFVIDQGGNLKSLKVSHKKQYILSVKKGKITDIDALKFGKLVNTLGGGRKEKNQKIDHSVGIVFSKKVGDKVRIGDLLCTLYVNTENIKEDITAYFTIK